MQSQLCSKTGLLKALESRRSWGIGSGQSNGQKRGLEQQLETLVQALQVGGGPYLTGVSVTLVRVQQKLLRPGICGILLQAES